MNGTQDLFEANTRSLEAQTVLAAELRNDETLLWSGMPPQGLLLRASDALAIPFSLLWGGFSIFWEVMAVSSGTLFMPLWGIPFVLVGLYLIIGRFLADSALRSRMYYGVTSRRVIIVAGWWAREVRSVALLGLTDVCVRERPNGLGMIILGPASPAGATTWGNPSWPSARSGRLVSPAVKLAHEVRRVYNIIEDARSAVLK